MQLPDVGSPPEPCRFPKLEECAHFHYERVTLPKLTVSLETTADQSLHSHHGETLEDEGWMVQVSSGDACWLLHRDLSNFKLLDSQLHQCIYDRKRSQLPDLSTYNLDAVLEPVLQAYLDRFTAIVDNSLNCGPCLNWFQMDNKGHRLLVPSEESRSINTPAVAAAYSIRKYVSQARDELSLEVGDMISVIDMANPGESIWWRGKRGFQVGFFPQHCVHIIGDKIPRNIPLPPPIVGTLALAPLKPVLRKHGKLITFFRSFILNRPSRRRLKQSGILKERVFGCDLGEHLLNTNREVPAVLQCCAEFIEKNGIVDGIYRLSGVTSTIQKLRNAFDEDRIPDLYTEEIRQDIHSVASLLKMYFRELPNPLCTYQLYQSFVGAVQGCHGAIRNSTTDHERLLKMREAVQKLPPPHYRTLEYLMKHLAAVARHHANTGMTTRNIAIVWAPNLLRCAELEVGGVAALQGVGVQAVVTEFLICYGHLIFCDRYDPPPTSSNRTSNCSPKKTQRPKSLAISTPAKLITLEEARTKHGMMHQQECGYIEVGGGPESLPKMYHTVIDLPVNRKRGLKRSPLGWRSFFGGKSRSATAAAAVTSGGKNRKASTPGIGSTEKSVTESDLTEMRRKLRSVKSAESLTSGHSEPADVDVLGPLFSLAKPQGHNRSVSHDSYFDTLQTSSQANSEHGSLLDLSEIQLNFELEESEMRMFSEDESSVSSPRRDLNRRVLRHHHSATNNPSPKKQARIVLLSPDLSSSSGATATSRKRTRLEEQLQDIQFIDCTTPDPMIAVAPSTTTVAVVHAEKTESYQPQKKSPRNSADVTTSSKSSPQLQALNLGDSISSKKPLESPITPQTPGYKQLDSSTNTTTSPLNSPTDLIYQNFPIIDRKVFTSPKYENVLTTISITYKSPPSKVKSIEGCYENVVVTAGEKAMVPTSTASLPNQEAAQPETKEAMEETAAVLRPKSMSALDEDDNTVVMKPNLSADAICDTTTELSMASFATDFSSNMSSRSNVQYTPSLSGAELIDEYRKMDSNTDLSLSEVVQDSSTENLSGTATSSPSFPDESASPNVSFDSSDNLIEFSPTTEQPPDTSVYEQVNFYRRSVSEVNALLDEPHESLDTLRRRDALPPCLRARNLRNQLKTCSLDEDEFARQTSDPPIKTHSLPKLLNQPKALPPLNQSHDNNEEDEEEDRKKRERIEKYKEERRKFLQEKYRSESFKEDKDVLLNQLKLFKVKETVVEQQTSCANNQRNKQQPDGAAVDNDAVDIRPRKNSAEFEMRRHTFESRQSGNNGTESRFRRVSLDSNPLSNKSTTTPGYCIKDMKAIFESK